MKERLDDYVALLTSDQVIDQPSKEPPLGLGSFTSSGSRMVRLQLQKTATFLQDPRAPNPASKLLQSGRLRVSNYCESGCQAPSIIFEPYSSLGFQSALLQTSRPLQSQFRAQLLESGRHSSLPAIKLLQPDHLLKPGRYSSTARLVAILHTRSQFSHSAVTLRAKLLVFSKGAQIG
ncbi:Hypothetical predicted protein [Prunus dulcis]|uniref:Uncharacterized protein n=1 Tax=Prunus dulcis TaxID=3755 RepID=A0A5E4EQW4_PRUDU|nr:Hypothetical predicted protein [Prunus dulcis]